MIALREISSEEARKLNRELHWSYWAIPIIPTIGLFVVTLVLNWLFNVPWSLFWWICGGLFILFSLGKLTLKKPPKLVGTIKIVRRGIVVDVVHKENRTARSGLNLGQHIDIVLPPEPIPAGFREQHTFTVYRPWATSYYHQDGSIRYRKAHLIGKEVEVEYLAESGKVIAFRELNPASNPPTVYMRWGSIQLSRKNTVLNQNRVDFVVLASDPYGNTGIFLRSDSVRDELFVPLYAKNLNRLEEWLFGLDGFDIQLYTLLKENPVTDEKLVWERQIKEGVSYQSVYAGERVSVLLGGIHVYRDNGHNETIQAKEIDYITLNSMCADKPNTEFFVNLRSFHQPSVSLQSRAEGFPRLERWMEGLPDFDAGQYRATKATVGETAETIWLRQPLANARLRAADNTCQEISALGKGIYLENKCKWLYWGTFRELARRDTKNGVAMKRTQYPNPSVSGYTYVIKNPVILGGLELDSLQTETPFWWPGGKLNPQWPVTSYWADVSFGNGGLDDFEQLEQHFTRLIGESNGHADPSAEDENTISAHWLVDRATIKVSTWKPYQLDVYRHSCRLEIACEPDVEHLYTDEYTKGLQLHDQLHYLVQEGSLSIASDYRYNSHCRYTPGCIAELIQTEGQYVIWRDEKYALLGIGNKRYAQVLALADVAGMNLKGAYWRDNPTELQVHMLPRQRKPGDMSSANYLGELNSPEGDSQWPFIREQWERFLDLSCTYSEDRQYY